MKIPFTKMCASGNDFIVIDNREGDFDPRNAGLIRRLCTRRLSVGADGLILLHEDSEYDFSMTYFNSDGLEAAMCGNGGRCIALFSHLIGIAEGELRFRSAAGVHSATLSDISEERADVTLFLPDPRGVETESRIRVGDELLSYGVIDTGVPHIVLKVEGLEELDVREKGERLRYHPRFEGEGTNVDFIEIKESNRICLRTYERGVEGETLSCGTGAVASAIMASLWTGMESPVTVETVSGEDLIVSFERKGSAIVHVSLRGKAEVVYHGVSREV